MAKDKKTEEKAQPPKVYMTPEAPRFATQSMMKVGKGLLTLGFGDPPPNANPKELHIHSRIVMPLATAKGLNDMLTKLFSEIEMNKTLKDLKTHSDDLILPPIS